jgi:hypothetical protein
MVEVSPGDAAVAYLGRTHILRTGDRQFDWSGTTVSTVITADCTITVGARLAETSQRNRYLSAPTNLLFLLLNA